MRQSPHATIFRSQPGAVLGDRRLPDTQNVGTFPLTDFSRMDVRTHRPTVESDTRIIFLYHRRRSIMSMSLLGNLYGNSTRPEVQITHRKIDGACTFGTASGCAPGHTDGCRWAQAL